MVVRLSVPPLPPGDEEIIAFPCLGLQWGTISRMSKGDDQHRQAARADVKFSSFRITIKFNPKPFYVFEMGNLAIVCAVLFC
jgi:hypothetical protein